MKYNFFVKGSTVCVVRAKVEYPVRVGNPEYDPPEDWTVPYDVPEEIEIMEEEYFPALEKAERFAARNRGTVIPLDASACEWMDGLTVGDAPDAYGEAVKIFEMGREAYEALKNAPAQEDVLLSMAVDHELRLTMLELGN